MNILAIDTSFRTASVAIKQQNRIIYSTTDSNLHQQSENLPHLIRKALNESNILFNSLYVFL